MSNPDNNSEEQLTSGSFSMAWILIALALVVLVMMRFMGPRAGPEPVQLGQPLPPLSAAGWLNTSSPPRPDDLHGRVVLVDCWASWCAPCREEIPHVAEFYQRFRGEGLVLLGLTPESGDEVADVKAYMAKVPGMDWPIGFGAELPLDMLGVNAYPTLILFDKSGRSVWTSHSLVGLEDAAVAALAEK